MTSFIPDWLGQTMSKLGVPDSWLPRRSSQDRRSGRTSRRTRCACDRHRSGNWSGLLLSGCHCYRRTSALVRAHTCVCGVALSRSRIANVTNLDLNAEYPGHYAGAVAGVGTVSRRREYVIASPPARVHCFSFMVQFATHLVSNTSISAFLFGTFERNSGTTMTDCGPSARLRGHSHE